MEAPSALSRKLAAVSILAASYVPSIGGLVYGLSQCNCDACCYSWFRTVGVLQGVVIPLMAGSYLFHQPLLFLGNWNIFIPILVQIAWLVGWFWLAIRGRGWLIVSTACVFGLSIFFAYGMYALIRA